MQRHYMLLSLLTTFIVGITIVSGYIDLKVSGLPGEIDIVSAHTAVIKPIAGIPLPWGMQSGDRLKSAAQPLSTRIVIGINILSQYLQATLPLDHVYDFVIERDKNAITVPVTSVKLGATSRLQTFQWMNDIDLSELHSSLSTDGYVFTMAAHGKTQYALICANRPGEHYPADDRALLAHVAHEMGMALYALRMRAQSQVMETLAKATLVTFPEIQSKARAFLSTTATS